MSIWPILNFLLTTSTCSSLVNKLISSIQVNCASTAMSILGAWIFFVPWHLKNIPRSYLVLVSCSLMLVLVNERFTSANVWSGSRNAMKSHETMLGLPDFLNDWVFDSGTTQFVPLLLVVKSWFESWLHFLRVSVSDFGCWHATCDTTFCFPRNVRLDRLLGPVGSLGSLGHLSTNIQVVLLETVNPCLHIFVALGVAQINGEYITNNLIDLFLQFLIDIIFWVRGVTIVANRMVRRNVLGDGVKSTVV